MGSLSIWHWAIVLIVVMLLFGTGKVSSLMGDFAKGIKSFKKHMSEESDPPLSQGRQSGPGALPNPHTDRAPSQSPATEVPAHAD